MGSLTFGISIRASVIYQSVIAILAVRTYRSLLEEGLEEDIEEVEEEIYEESSTPDNEELTDN